MLEVGVGLVSRFGAKALSLTSVARHAGVARATAYRMFGGREALVSAIVAHELAQLQTELERWAAGEPDIPTRVRKRVVGSLRHIRGHQALQYILRNEPEEVVRSIVSVEGSTGPSLIDMIVDSALERLPDDEAAAMYPSPRAGIEYMVRTVYSCMLVPESSMSDDEIADMVVRAVIR